MCYCAEIQQAVLLMQASYTAASNRQVLTEVPADDFSVHLTWSTIHAVCYMLHHL